MPDKNVKKDSLWRVATRPGSVEILITLSKGECRFNDLEKKADTTRQTLSVRLRELEEKRLIETFQVVKGKKSHSEYRLTEKGKELAADLEQAVKNEKELAEKWGEQIFRMRLFKSLLPIILAICITGVVLTYNFPETTSDLLYISNVEELQAMRNDLGGHYVLDNDIDASETWNWNNWEGFDPIGATYDAPFTGSLNGNGHVIRNLYINCGRETVGLFGFTSETAVIENLGLENVQIQGGWHGLGALVGRLEGSVSQCYATGTVFDSKRSDSSIGGLIGKNTGRVTNSYSLVNVDGSTGNNSNVSGFIGYNESPNLQNNYAIGTVEGSGTLCGFATTASWLGGTNSFFTGPDCVNGATQKTDEEMKIENTFTSAGWDFENIWDISPNINNGYPFLRIFHKTPPDDTPDDEVSFEIE